MGEMLGKLKDVRLTPHPLVFNFFSSFLSLFFSCFYSSAGAEEKGGLGGEAGERERIIIKS